MNSVQATQNGNVIMIIIPSRGSWLQTHHLMTNLVSESHLTRIDRSISTSYASSAALFSVCRAVNADMHRHALGVPNWFDIWIPRQPEAHQSQLKVQHTHLCKSTTDPSGSLSQGTLLHFERFRQRSPVCERAVSGALRREQCIVLGVRIHATLHSLACA